MEVGTGSQHMSRDRARTLSFPMPASMPGAALASAASGEKDRACCVSQDRTGVGLTAERAVHLTCSQQLPVHTQRVACNSPAAGSEETEVRGTRPPGRGTCMCTHTGVHTCTCRTKSWWSQCTLGLGFSLAWPPGTPQHLSPGQGTAGCR